MAVKTEVKKVRINNHELNLTNPDKVIWPEDGLTKADMVKYYADISEYLLSFLKNRLFVMCRFPHGIDGEFFYQKECPSYAPDWVETFPIQSEGSGKIKNYIVCNNLETLIWLANQSCIEMHPWLSRIPLIDQPDVAVFDLDPMPGVTFQEVLKVGVLLKEALDAFGIKGYPKTSGSTGLHVYVPVKPGYSYAQVRDFAQFILKHIHEVYPSMTTFERLIQNRTGKIYLDYLQNGRGKTMACQFSLRPHKRAPVSTPLTWDEVKKGDFIPGDYTISNILERLKKKGNPYSEMENNPQDIDGVLKLI